MKEIHLWQISKSQTGKPSVMGYTSINQTETEEMLEEVLVKSPDLLIPGLKLVGRQTDTPGGPLDLLGVDEDGRLIVFELKRGTLTRDAVAQLIDYASFLSTLNPDELSTHISDRSGKLGIEKIDNFSEWYQEQFAKNLFEIPNPRLFLVGLGVDERTRRMVSFLADSEIDISLITFHGFQDDEKIILAKQVEVEARQQSTTVSNTKEGNLEKLHEKILKLQVSSFYEKLAKFFQNNLSPAYQWPNQGGYSLYLPEITETGSQSNRVYVSLYLHEGKLGKVQLYFHPRAINAAGENWNEILTNFDIEIKKNDDGSAEIWVCSIEDCDKIISQFEKVCQVIIQGWKQKRELMTSNQNPIPEDENTVKSIE